MAQNTTTTNLWPMWAEEIDKDFNLDRIVELAAPFLWPEQKTCGIYFLLDCDEIVYIGRSKNLRARFLQHSSSDKIFNRHFYVFCREENADEIEAFFILQFKPKYNKRIPINEKILD